jgi:hypothetical protein
MKINRHNYEEYFILYWDNELAAEQKQAVENFVKENPDLQEEFSLFGQTRFAPDNTLQFTQKDLLANESSFINIVNYTEKLLDYIDDELTADEKIKTEQFVAGYQPAQKELALLQKIKLQPEAETVFPDKSVLYRRTEKVRVIKLTWQRVAVAAAVILVAGLVTFRLVSINKSEVPPIVKTKPVNPPEIQSGKVESLATNTEKSQEIKSKGESTAPGEENPKLQNENLFTNATLADNKTKNKNNLPEVKSYDEQTLAAKNETEQVQESDFNLLPSREKTYVALVNEEQKKSEELFDNNSVTPGLQFAFNPVNEATDKQQKDGGGLKEFLRKSTRLFERRTKIQTTTDDNKLLVGVFAVSLK